MYDSNEAKWLDAGSLPMDSLSKPGRVASELEEAPEILITYLDDLKQLHQIFQAAFKRSVEAKRE